MAIASSQGGARALEFKEAKGSDGHEGINESLSTRQTDGARFLHIKRKGSLFVLKKSRDEPVTQTGK